MGNCCQDEKNDKVVIKQGIIKGKNENNNLENKKENADSQKIVDKNIKHNPEIGVNQKENINSKSNDIQLENESLKNQKNESKNINLTNLKEQKTNEKENNNIKKQSVLKNENKNNIFSANSEDKVEKTIIQNIII